MHSQSLNGDGEDRWREQRLQNQLAGQCRRVLTDHLTEPNVMTAKELLVIKHIAVVKVV